MVMAGGAASRKLNLDAFLQQAAEYDEWEPGWDKLSRLRIEIAPGGPRSSKLSG